MTRREPRVVVAGAGGLGCPIVWSLAEAGVGRIAVLDPDRIEPSNLPRQVLYRPEDVGRPKVEVMKERLVTWATIDARFERLDETNEAEVLAGADLLIDATDGARTKDWLNALAVRRRIAFVHAAAMRSEGRLLEVPAGGRPCLACLYGRVEEEHGACADLGIWNGVAGATGFLAAAAALRRLEDPTGPRDGYIVLDFEAGRAVRLAVPADEACPVCSSAADLAAEPLPGLSCAADRPGADDRVGGLDLRDESCPMNLLRARRAVEDLEPGASIEIRLGSEGRESVVEGLRGLGHRSVVTKDDPRERVLFVVRGVRQKPFGERLPRALLQQFARQVVLPGFGEEGQCRLRNTPFEVVGKGPDAEVARLYLEAAGLPRDSGSAPVGEGGPARYRVDLGPGEPASGRMSGAALAAVRARGCLVADAASRDIVLGRVPPSTISIDPYGRVGR